MNLKFFKTQTTNDFILLYNTCLYVYVTELLIPCRYLQHSLNVILPFSVLLLLFYQVMCTSIKSSSYGYFMCYKLRTSFPSKRLLRSSTGHVHYLTFVGEYCAPRGKISPYEIFTRPTRSLRDRLVSAFDKGYLQI